MSALFAGVGSSGWIVLLLSTFNYIAACVGVMLFRNNDPFHFGGLGKAFLTLQTMEIMVRLILSVYLGGRFNWYMNSYSNVPLA